MLNVNKGSWVLWYMITSFFRGEILLGDAVVESKIVLARFGVSPDGVLGQWIHDMVFDTK